MNTKAIQHFNSLKKSPLLAIIILLIFLNGILFFWISGQYLTLSGDEGDYYNASKRLVKIFSNFLGGEWGKIPALWSGVINHGWFIPTTSLLISPLLYFTEDIGTIRFFLFLLNFLLTVKIIFLSKEVFGFRVTLLLALSMLLMPMYNIYSFTLWGGAIGGRLLLLLFLYLARLEAQQNELNLRRAAKLGVLLAITLYFRNSVILISVMIVVFIAFHNVKRLDSIQQAIVPTLKQALVLATTVVLLILPWSISISKKFDIPTLTVTSSNMAYLICCADQKLRKEIQKAHRTSNFYRDVYTYYSKKANNNVKDIYKLMSEDNQHARQNIKPKKVKRLIGLTFRNILMFNYGGFINRFASSMKGHDKELTRPYYKYVKYLYSNFWCWLLIFYSIFLCIPFSTKALHAGILLKSFVIVSILPHFIIFAANSRHNVVILPLLLFIFSYIISLKIFNRQMIDVDFRSISGWLNIIIQITFLALSTYLFYLYYLVFY